jgi:hypothetical protein
MKLTISKLILYLILPLTALLTQCGSTKSIRSPTPKVPIAILISTDNSPDIFGLNDEYYTYHIMDVLDNFPEYDLVLVNYDENPEVVCNLYINNFNIWPKDERVYRRSFSKNIQSGVELMQPASRFIRLFLRLPRSFKLLYDLMRDLQPNSA